MQLPYHAQSAFKTSLVWLPSVAAFVALNSWEELCEEESCIEMGC